jgi:putative (di)nucleoside polyphosphate hydrolase
MASEEKYRPNVCVIVSDGCGNVLLCKRVDERDGGTWQTVQGGIDDGEAVLDAALRETWEELGIVAEDILVRDVMEERYAYRWDDDHIVAWGSGFVGQEQVFVLIEVSRDVAMNLNAQHREFLQVCWGSPEELLAKSWERKKPGLRAALIRFGFLVAES